MISNQLNLKALRPFSELPASLPSLVKPTAGMKVQTVSAESRAGVLQTRLRPVWGLTKALLLGLLQEVYGDS